MSLLGKLGLISQWQSSLQCVNPINDSSNRALDSLKRYFGGLLVLLEYLNHQLHNGANLFRANTFIVFVSS
jgi:hypothetical protein